MKFTTDPIDYTTERFFREAANLGFELREEQIEMGHDVSRAIMEQKPLAVEAGVGTGKSFAYLVPCILQYLKTGKQIVISTSTIALQEQLERDADVVFKMLGAKPNVVVAKGMKNYICQRRVSNKMKKNPDNEFLRRIWRAAISWRQDKATVNLNMEESQWESVSIDHYGCDDCNGCAYRETCQYNCIRKSVRAGKQIVICNHNMLVSHLTSKAKGFGIFSPSCDTFVIDEAHHLEPLFRDTFTKSYSKKELVDAISSGIHVKEKKEAALADEACKEISKLFTLLAEQVCEQEKETDGDVTAFFMHRTTKVANTIIRARRALRSAEELTGRSSGVLNFLCEVSNSFKKNIVWLQSDASIRICVCKKDICDDISRLLFAPNRTTILTSATIADKQSGTAHEKYAYYLGSIGFPANGMVSEPKKSPFDYSQNAALFCSKALPYPNQENRAEYHSQSIDEIVKLLSITNGKSLILFTAKSDMEYVYKKLSNLHLPYKILKQSGSSSQAHRLESFTNDVNSVILGCGAFWEGINVEGESLSQVIIFKLPFPVPEPILEYKMSLVENPIEAVAVPEMILKLKQGAGRLIRSSTDTGIISVLDPRASVKYAETIRAALPDMQLALDIDVLSDIWHRIAKTKEAA